MKLPKDANWHSAAESLKAHNSEVSLKGGILENEKSAIWGSSAQLNGNSPPSYISLACGVMLSFTPFEVFTIPILTVLLGQSNSSLCSMKKI